MTAALFDKWHLELPRHIHVKFLWFACDDPASIPSLRKVAELLSGYSREKKRCYVLIGYGGEALRDAETRLKTVYELGFLPFAMPNRPTNHREDSYSADWMRLRRTWTHPAAYKAAMKGVVQ